MEFLFYSETYKSLLQLAVASWSQFTNFQFLRQLHFLLCPGTHAVKPYRFHVGKAPCILDLSTRWPWASDYEDPGRNFSSFATNLFEPFPPYLGDRNIVDQTSVETHGGMFSA